jgi:hypothetical protein
MGRVSGGGGGGGAAGGAGTYSTILRLSGYGGTVNDVDLVGLTPGCLVLLDTSSNFPNFTGFLRNGFADGQYFDLLNVGTVFTLMADNSGSAAANRFYMQSSAQSNANFVKWQGTRLIYDGTALRWRGLMYGSG